MPTQGEQLKASSHISSNLYPDRWKIQEEKLQKRTFSYSNQGTSQTNGPHKVIKTNESKMSSFSFFFFNLSHDTLNTVEKRNSASQED